MESNEKNSCMAGFEREHSWSVLNKADGPSEASELHNSSESQPSVLLMSESQVREIDSDLQKNEWDNTGEEEKVAKNFASSDQAIRTQLGVLSKHTEEGKENKQTDGEQDEAENESEFSNIRSKKFREKRVIRKIFVLRTDCWG